MIEGLSKAQISKAMRLWREGVSTTKIANDTGISRYRVLDIKTKRPDLFPARIVRGGIIEPLDKPIQVNAKTVFADGMQWTTITGNKVTLARVSMIECPRNGERA